MDILLMVIAVDACVMGVSLVALYYLNKAAEQNNH
jgi:hypothetical protein